MVLSELHLEGKVRCCGAILLLQERRPNVGWDGGTAPKPARDSLRGGGEPPCGKKEGKKKVQKRANACANERGWIGTIRIIWKRAQAA